MSLTPNTISRMVRNGESVDKPVVQVLSIKPVENTDRFRCVLSDGTHSHAAVLTSQLSPQVSSGVVQPNCLVKLNVASVKPLRDAKIIVVVDMSVVGNMTAPIGNPVDLNAAPAAAMAAAPAPAPAAYGAGSGAGNTGGYGGYGGDSKTASTSIYGNTNTSYGGGAVARTQDMNVSPISVLNPYNNRWTIKARVTSKSDIREWSNAKGSGKLCSIELLDEMGGEIRGTFFKEQVDKFYDVLQVDKVYYISNGRIKMANKRYNNTNNNYELTFDRSTTIQPAPDDNKIQLQSYSFSSLKSLADLEPQTVDVLGVCTEVGEMAELTTKSGKETCKRDIVLVDSSPASIKATLWGDAARQPADQFKDAIIAFKGIKLSDFNGKSLSAWSSTRMALNPDITEAARLRAWFQANGAASAVSLSATRGAPDASKRTTIAAITENNLAAQDGGSRVTIKGWVTMIRNKSLAYPSCPLKLKDNPDRTCNKRVNKDTGDRWMCERCQQAMDKPVYRYVFSAQITDHTGCQWVTMFDEAGTALLQGRKADEMQVMAEADAKLSEDNEVDASVPKVLKACTYQPVVLRVACRTEMYQDEERIKVSASAVYKIKWATESKSMITAINRYFE